MIKYKLKASAQFRLVGRPVEEAFVYLPTTNPNIDIEICYEGPEQLIKEIKFDLIGSYGERGRTISEETTAYDLNSAMHGQYMAQFEPELVEGREILQAD